MHTYAFTVIIRDPRNNVKCRGNLRTWGEEEEVIEEIISILRPQMRDGDHAVVYGGPTDVDYDPETRISFTVSKEDFLDAHIPSDIS